MTDFVKKPCKKCPFRNDIRPYLHPQRAAEIACASTNRYSDFPCHKTVNYDSGEEDHEGNQIADLSESKTCAGFLTMRASYIDKGLPKDFIPEQKVCFTNIAEMVEAYTTEWNKNTTKKNK
jgi:hypothetical protein